VPIILLGVKSFTGLVLDISIGLPAALAYYAVTIAVTAPFVVWAIALQRKLPGRMAEELKKAADTSAAT
jgi:hypothetical protein